MYQVDELIDHIRNLEKKVVDVDPQKQAAVDCCMDSADTLYVRAENHLGDTMLTVKADTCCENCGERGHPAIFIKDPEDAKRVLSVVMQFLEDQEK